MDDDTPPSEAVNELTRDLDALDALGFVRALRASDAQLFAGWKSHAGLLDCPVLDRAESFAQSAAQVIRLRGVIVFTGCGTSGRVAYLTARRYNLSSGGAACFDYLISGGDAALVLSDELPEDDPTAGAAELAELAHGRSAVALVGISCGLSAPYVAGQLDHALASPMHASAASSSAKTAALPSPPSPPVFAAAALGFNPARLARAAPIAGLRCGAKSFRELLQKMNAGGVACHVVLDPVVGPEPIAGSSRMKGGSATLALCDALCYRALCLAAPPTASSPLSHGSGGGASSPAPPAAPTIAQLLRQCEAAARATYQQPEALAAVATLAARAMSAGGRLLYVGEGVAGILGVIDASEMPDTYGVPFDAVRAFVGGGWEAAPHGMANRRGPAVREASPLLRLSLEDFEADVLPTLSPADTVLLLGCGAEPMLSHEQASDGGHGSSPPPPVAALPSTRLMALVPQMRRLAVGGIGLVAAACAKDLDGVAVAAAAAGLDAVSLTALARVGFAPGHGGLAELSLKLSLNVISTYAMTARGLVYSNRMISTSPTNDKIYHRCVRLVAELARCTEAHATHALIRAVHKNDAPSAELLGAPVVVHITAATPMGDAQLQQQMVLPLALVLATCDGCTVREAQQALTREPRVSRLIHELRSSLHISAQATALRADAPRTMLGLDLGTTCIKAAVVRVEGGAFTSQQLRLSVVGAVMRSPLPPELSVESVVAALARAAECCLAACPKGPLRPANLVGVGVSQPGHVADPSTGVVEAAANLPLWRNVPLGALLATALGVRCVHVTEDANAAMLAELAHGGAAAPPQGAGAAERSAHTAVLLVVGGGVGSSVALGGKLHRGASGMVEGGHMLVPGVTEADACGCGQVGCLEVAASAAAIVRRARAARQVEVQAGQAAEAVHPREDEEGEEKLVQQAADVAQLAASGDAIAAQVMAEAAEALAAACVSIARLLDPHVIVLAGGVASPTLVAHVAERAKQKAWTILPHTVPVRRATAGADAGVLGAAAVAAMAVEAAPAAPAELPPRFTVRRATMADRAGAFRVCLLTGDEGADASALYPHDPDALGTRWVGPYLVLQPELAFVLHDGEAAAAEEKVAGYCLAALDTRTFAGRLQAEYLPPLRAQHAKPAICHFTSEELSREEQVYSELHDERAGEPPAGLDVDVYPSHVHIDLVAAAQGAGHGSRLMRVMLDALRAAGSCGVHLQMHAGNTRARRFYEKLGFEQLPVGGSDGGCGTGGELYLGLRLA